MIPREEVRVVTIPIMPVDQRIAVGTHAGGDTTQGYLFLHIPSGEDRVPERGSLFLTAPQRTVLLEDHLEAANVEQSFFTHSFSSGEEASRACTGEDVETIMQRAFWESPKTAWRHIHEATRSTFPRNDRIH